MKRHEARQKALQAIFQIDVGQADTRDAIAHVMEDVTATPSDYAYVERLVLGTIAHQQEIDAELSAAVTGWQLERVAKVELCVMRLAVFEMYHELDVDLATIADEAVRLAKTFSTDESGRFVNGVLAKVIPAAAAKRASQQQSAEQE